MASCNKDPAAKAIADIIQRPISDDMIAFVSRKASTVIKCEPRPMTAPVQLSRPQTTSTGVEIPTLPSFVEQIARKSNVKAGTFLASTVYLDRLEKRLPKEASGMYCTLHRVFLAALIVTSKYINDASPKNRHWSRCSGCFSLAEVNLMESQLLGLLDYDLRISSDDLTSTLTPLMPHSPSPLTLSLTLPSPVSCKVTANVTAPPVRVAAPAPEPSQKQSLFVEQDRPEMGDWDAYDSDSDSDDEDELAEEPMMNMTIAAMTKAGVARSKSKNCNVTDSPLDPYTPFSPIVKIQYPNTMYPPEITAVDFDNENEVDTFLRPFGLENETKGNWLESLANGWDEQDDEDDLDDLEDMEKDDEEEDVEVEIVWTRNRAAPRLVDDEEDEEDDDLPALSYSRRSTDRRNGHLRPNFPQHALRRYSACSTLSSVSSTQELRTPTEFHHDLPADVPVVTVLTHKQFHGHEINAYDDHSTWNNFKHTAMYDEPKRPRNQVFHHPQQHRHHLLNSKPPVTAYQPAAVEVAKEIRTGGGGIFARVFRQASRHR